MPDPGNARRPKRNRLSLSTGVVEGDGAVLRVAYASSDGTAILDLYAYLVQREQSGEVEVAHVSYNADTGRFLAAIHGSDAALQQLTLQLSAGYG